MRIIDLGLGLFALLVIGFLCYGVYGIIVIVPSYCTDIEEGTLEYHKCMLMQNNTIHVNKGYHRQQIIDYLLLNSTEFCGVLE